MVKPYFIAAPVGLGALVLQRTFRRKKGPRDEEVRRRDGDGDETAFACERVCSSDRLIKRLGYLSKVRPRPDVSNNRRRYFTRGSVPSVATTSPQDWHVHSFVAFPSARAFHSGEARDTNRDPSLPGTRVRLDVVDRIPRRTRA